VLYLSVHCLYVVLTVVSSAVSISTLFIRRVDSC
jgi:hypothetical protein